jgi:hypothetical protein
VGITFKLFIDNMDLKILAGIAIANLQLCP